MQDGINPLLDACSRGDTAIVKVLLSASGVNTNIVGRVSWR
jgi:ankyrin repeat protein